MTIKNIDYMDRRDMEKYLTMKMRRSEKDHMMNKIAKKTIQQANDMKIEMMKCFI